MRWPARLVDRRPSARADAASGRDEPPDRQDGRRRSRRTASAMAREFAMERKVTLVLKGYRTLIAFPDGRVWINPTGTPGHGHGRHGRHPDRIHRRHAGAVPAATRIEAVAAAVYLHGLAGELGASGGGREIADGDRSAAIPSRAPWRNVPVYRTASEEETIALGERLARELPPGTVVLLIGNLGAGKTTLAKGIVQGPGRGAAGRSLEPDVHADPRIRRAGAGLSRRSLPAGRCGGGGDARPRRAVREARRWC